MQYQHLLVPVDLTNPDPATLDAAFDMAMQHRARTTLLHIIESIHTEDEHDTEVEHFYAKLEASVRERLAEFAQRFQDAELVVQQEIVVGRRARDIVRYSATHSVDLIVLRSDRVDPTRPREAVAKVSHQVSMFCQCPVMLVKSST